jgi:hypothetical protein
VVKRATWREALVKRILLLVEGGEPAGADPALREALLVFFRPLSDSLETIGWSLEISTIGSRFNAAEDYRLSLETNSADAVALLIDSEEPIVDGLVEHLRLQGERSGKDWDLTGCCREELCYYMCRCAETWLSEDLVSLGRYYGDGFDADRLRDGQPSEEWSVEKVLNQLKAATRHSERGTYHKRNHTPGIFRTAQASVVMHLAHCKRLFTDLPLYLDTLI